MPKLIRYNNKLKNSRSKKERNTWRKDRRRSSPPRPSSFRGNKTRWMHSRRSSKLTWTKDLSWERQSTTNFFKDIRMSKKKLRTNRTSIESSSKSNMLASPTRDLKLLNRVLWVPECKEAQRWSLSKLCPIPMATQPPNHLTWSEELSLRTDNALTYKILVWI